MQTRGCQSEQLLFHIKIRSWISNNGLTEEGRAGSLEVWGKWQDYNHQVRSASVISDYIILTLIDTNFINKLIKKWFLLKDDKYDHEWNDKLILLINLWVISTNKLATYHYCLLVCSVNQHHFSWQTEPEYRALIYTTNVFIDQMTVGYLSKLFCES